MTDAIRDGAPIPDEKLAALAGFVRHLVVTRGRPSREAARAFLRAGYSEVQVLYLFLAIAVKTMSNFSNHQFDTPVDSIFKARAWSASRVA